MSGRRIELPRRERRYGFSLTPLADAMFQLLIFFMLSSSLTPYSLLTLRAADAAAPRDELREGLVAAEDAPEPQDAVPDANLWTLETDGVRARNQFYTFDILPDVARALTQASPDVRIILNVAAEARVQDLTTVLAVLRRSDIANVSVIRFDEGG